jgi:UDP-N-acetylglucosamine--N-acetylmuramyl-(pentapeptide) pyrophosphoryl-undecaprenol N-acetylglucosamine transferase
LAKWGHRYEVRHQTGRAARDETEARYRERGIQARVEAFIEDMPEAYAWADVAVCRAGAMTVSELAAAGLPAVLVPYPYAIDDHQSVNAHFFADAGAGICLPQSQLTAETLAAELERLCTNPDRLKVMGERARSLATLDAAERVAEVCLREAIE